MTRPADSQPADEAPPVDPDLLEIFRQETEGHIQAIRTHLPALAGGAAEVVQTVRRAAHTLKGSAAMVGFRALTRLAHRMEDVLDRMAEGRPPTPDILDLLRVSTDRLEDLAAGKTDLVLTGLYGRYADLLGAADSGGQPDASPARAAPGPAQGPVERKSAGSFVRVPLERLDELTRLVSELTVARATFEQRLGACRSQVAAAGDECGRLDGDAEDLLERQARLTRDIHDRLMHIRLAPFGTLAARLRRTVREVAERSGKPVDLTLEGDAVGVDKAVLEDVAEPLMHLLRNAVDHGIEPPDLRRERGKPERGRLTVRAAHEGDQVVMRVADDGGGVDVEAVRARAVERGLTLADAAARMTEPELFGLVFLPGFSTAKQISETSGRGVGLDVVRASVERLKGSVTLASRPGEGTTFTLRLPMTVAVTHALMVRTFGQTFALPLAAVGRVARIGVDAATEGDGRMRIDNEVYSCVVLGDALGLRRPAATDPGRPAALLVQTGEGRVAVVVDEVQGAREIVVKDLGTHLRKVHGVSGATLTGDGAVVLILNPAECTRPPAAIGFAPAADPPREQRPLSVLVVDDSPSIRRALRLLIEALGWTVRAARDGQEGLELLTSGPAPDVMLVDVDMPRMNGYEFLSQVKGTEAYRPVPVVMVTSRAGGRDRRMAQELGADGYVVKPYRDDELIATIRRVTEARAAQPA